ncbi:hypothetical protein, partial [Microbulbifer litoralis]|uniref:hypothetical protein n=1 Tax=Microbulbifer litoralis TaxID=2933965 RepID=UPI0020292532
MFSFGHNLANQFDSLHRRQHGNGLASERDYDPQGRLHKVRLGKADGPAENPLLERGNRIAAMRGKGGKLQTRY